MKNSAQRFVPRMYQNALCDLQIPPDANHNFYVMCPDTLLVETAAGAPVLEK
jgi:hypothetical protein